MGNFDLNSYAQVKDRIAEFYVDYPGGSIRTFVVRQEGKEILFEARVYRTVEEAVAGVYTSGFARELEGDGMVNKSSHVENCETSAIGRALANLDYCGSIGGQKAPRPSREEMSKAERQPAKAPSGNGGLPWDRPMPIGKNKGTPLRDLSQADLSGALDWCNGAEDRADKFRDLVGAIEATLENFYPNPDAFR